MIRTLLTATALYPRNVASLGFLLFLPILMQAGAHLPASSVPGAGGNQGEDVVPGLVVMRLRQGVDAASGTTEAAILDILPGSSGRFLKPAFPHIRPLTRLEYRPGAIDLSAVQQLSIPESADPRAVARDISRLPIVEWAEPLYLHRLLDVPNDPGFPSQQAAFARLRLTDGWTIAKGSRSVIIAVIDGGTMWDHEDLAANIRVNTPEDLNGNGRLDVGAPPAGDINGADDDGNGFVDDVIGWNFTNNTNNPGGVAHAPGSFSHGTAVASHFGAVTDNGLGMAGSGWNCSILPVCAASARGDNLIAFGYHGIVYAYQNGARIINCSWGRQGSYSRFEEEVITAATQAGALVVAAAGNQATDNDGVPHYPSSYDDVLAVGATNSTDDRKAGFSNYGAGVDVFAPGVSIYSALTGSVKYGDGGSGTSYASPLVAGIAGILASQYPGWTPAQLKMQIRMTADPIDAVNDASFAGRLGRGRANLHRALRESPPGIAITAYDVHTTTGKDIFLPGDTVALRLTVRNVMFTTATALQWTATPRDPTLRVVQNQVVFGSLSPGTEAQLAPVLFRVDPVVNPREVVIDVVWTGFGGLVDAAPFRVTVFPELPVWLAQESPTSSPLYSVRAVDRNVAWAAGGSGGNPVVARTVDGGATWMDATGDLAWVDLYCIFAVDSSYAWVGTATGSIYRTTDGGMSWTRQLYSGTQSPFINGIWFFDRNRGLALGDPPGNTGQWVVVRTTNGGDSWASVFTPPLGVPSEAGWNNSFWWANSRCGWFGTNQDKVWRTTDGGDSWYPSQTGAPNSFAVAFSDSLVGIACHEGGDLRRTTDGGVTWSRISTGSVLPLGAAAFAPGASAACICDDNTPYGTRDGGISWEQQTAYPFRGSLQHLTLADTSTGWAVVSTGEILRYTAGLPQGPDPPEEPEVPAAVRLEQNYPNPFNGTTTIRFSLPAESAMRLELFDLLGRSIRLLAEGVRPAGISDVTLEGRGLSSGAYIYRLEARAADASFRVMEARRLVLIR